MSSQTDFHTDPTPKKESGRSASNTPSRLYALFIIIILKKYSNPEHPLSLKEIQELTNKNFDISPGLTVSTVSRILEELIHNHYLGFDNVFMEDFKDPQGLGFNIFCVCKDKQGNWIFLPEAREWDPDSEEARPKAPTKFYYYENTISDPEIIALIDSMSAYNYFSSKDNSKLVSKLIKLNPSVLSNRKYHLQADRKLRPKDSYVLDNIRDINEIIHNDQFAEITYCNYAYDSSEKRLKLKKRNGYPKIVYPISLLWSNGFYYMVARDDPKHTPQNLRIDRIAYIEAIENDSAQEPDQRLTALLQKYETNTIIELKRKFRFTADNPTEFNALEYRLQHPVMYGGKKEHISMLVKSTPTNGLLNALMDTYGQPDLIRTATEEEIMKYLPANYSLQEGEEWFFVRIFSTPGGTELFATQYCQNVRVISPDSIVERVETKLNASIKLYQH